MRIEPAATSNNYGILKMGFPDLLLAYESASIIAGIAKHLAEDLASGSSLKHCPGMLARLSDSINDLDAAPVSVWHAKIPRTDLLCFEQCAPSCLCAASIIGRGCRHVLERIVANRLMPVGIEPEIERYLQNREAIIKACDLMDAERDSVMTSPIPKSAVMDALDVGETKFKKLLKSGEFGLENDPPTAAASKYVRMFAVDWAEIKTRR